MPPRQHLSGLAASALHPGTQRRDAVRCSLEELQAACDPQRMGLVRGGELAIDIQDPFEPAVPVPVRKTLKDVLYVTSFNREAASDVGSGVGARAAALATRVFSEALRQCAPLSGHEGAMLSVATALGNCRQIGVYRSPSRNAEGDLVQRFSVQCVTGAHELGETLRRLPDGGHALFLITNGNFAGSHMTGLSVSRREHGLARLSFVNPIDEQVGRFVDLPIHHIEQGLQRFFSGTSFENTCSNYVPKSHADHPVMPEAGTIFTEWMKSLQPGKPLSSAYHGDRPFMQVPQKGGSCTIESVFALLATTLPRDAYKLAKSACLSTLLALGESTGVMATAEKVRIEERMQSAWRGIGTEAQPGKFRASSR